MNELIKKATKHPLILISCVMALFFITAGLLLITMPTVVLPNFESNKTLIGGLLLCLYGCYRLFFNYRRLKYAE